MKTQLRQIYLRIALYNAVHLVLFGSSCFTENSEPQLKNIPETSQVISDPQYPLDPVNLLSWYASVHWVHDSWVSLLALSQLASLYSEIHS